MLDLRKTIIIIVIIAAGLSFSTCGTLGETAMSSSLAEEPEGKTAMSVSLADEPEWVADTVSVYPPDAYISRNGFGDTREAARASALTNLTAHFSQEIETELKEVVVVDETGISSSNIIASTVIASKQELVAQDYAEDWYDAAQKTWHALAFINRDRAWELIEPDLKVKTEPFMALYKKAKAETDPLNHYTLYQNVIAGIPNDALHDLLSAKIYHPEKASAYNDVLTALSQVTFDAEQAKIAQSPYWTGWGGNGVQIAVLDPQGVGMTSVDDSALLPMIQGTLAGDIGKFSAMEVVPAERNARYILSGKVTKTKNGYTFGLTVTDARNGEIKASYTPKVCDYDSLYYQSAAKEACEDILAQLSIHLTSAGKEELHKTEARKAIAQAQFAKGISQSNGGQINFGSMVYFYVADSLDPELVGAANRTSAMTVTINNANTIEAMQNKIVWRKQWETWLTETEEAIRDIVQNYNQPYALLYTKELKESNLDYNRETVSYSFTAELKQSADWTSAIQKALASAKKHLTNTGFAQEWGYSNWPRSVVSTSMSLNSFKNFNITAELLNSKDKVIGKTNFSLRGSWDITDERVNTSTTGQQTITFHNVNVFDLTQDSLSLRIASVNGIPTAQAARSGILQVVLRDQYRDAAGYDIDGYNVAGFDINGYNRKGFNSSGYDKNGFDTHGRDKDGYDRSGYDLAGYTRNGVSKDGKTVILTMTNTRLSVGSANAINEYIGPENVEIIIPSKLNGITITYIGDYTFDNKNLKNVTIPDTVTYIGVNAFKGNKIEKLNIPESVRFVGRNAFFGNPLKEITLGTEVNLNNFSWFRSSSEYCFPSFFDQAYQNGKKTSRTWLLRQQGTDSWAWGYMTKNSLAEIFGGDPNFFQSVDPSIRSDQIR
ncbi:MAG: leucine-rich repeat domain-containing protein [Spirochaetaceae bacterium]|nr:leucine-rich repeat domain-containing protein [Spirochaetaceae bacterium]